MILPPALLEGPADFAALAILALLQGLTEFLPISSSGHLVLAQAAMGFEEPQLALDVALHVGTLLAVCVVYRRDLLQLLRSLAAGDGRELGLLALATLPAAVVGLAFKDALEAAFHEPRFAAGGLFATGAILLVGEAARKRGPGTSEEDAAERPMRWWHALVIGSAQALAIWPGISRSGSTIAAGMLCGLPPARAARFSFLMAIPAILGAAVLQLPDAAEDPARPELTAILWAAAFAGFVGWGALRILLAFLGRGAFAWFAAYCFALGLGTLVLA